MFRQIGIHLSDKSGHECEAHGPPAAPGGEATAPAARYSMVPNTAVSSVSIASPRFLPFIRNLTIRQASRPRSAMVISAVASGSLSDFIARRPLAVDHNRRPVRARLVSRPRLQFGEHSVALCDRVERHGPVSDNILLVMIARDELSPDVLVWRQGHGEWIPACDMAEIKAAVRRATPGPGPSADAPPPSPEYPLARPWPRFLARIFEMLLLYIPAALVARRP